MKKPLSLVWERGFGPYKYASALDAGGGSVVLLLFLKPPDD
jgi:hypothetical protein